MKDTGRSSGHGPALPKFLQQALGHPLITRAEERRLARKAKKAPKGPIKDAKARDDARRAHEEEYAARDELVLANLRFILQQTLRHARFGRGGTDDAFQEAVLGHLEAIARFKTGKNTRLSTYASWWIRHAVLRYGQDHGRTVRIPVHTLQDAYALTRVAQRFARLHGRQPDADELAAAAGIPKRRIERVRVAMQDAVSLDATHCDLAGRVMSVKDIVPDPAATPAEDAALAHDARALQRAMAVLTPFEAAIIRCRFFEEKTLVETARELAGSSRHGEELSRERIRQIEAAALAKLRGALT